MLLDLKKKKMIQDVVVVKVLILVYQSWKSPQHQADEKTKQGG